MADDTATKETTYIPPAQPDINLDVATGGGTSTGTAEVPPTLPPNLISPESSSPPPAELVTPTIENSTPATGAPPYAPSREAMGNPASAVATPPPSLDETIDGTKITSNPAPGPIEDQNPRYDPNRGFGEPISAGQPAAAQTPTAVPAMAGGNENSSGAWSWIKKNILRRG